MNLLAPDLLMDLRDVPVAALGTLLVLGLGLWLCGWWWHRFWITVLTSFVAGIVGLHLGPRLGVNQPVVAGVLLALAGGGLALSLARLAVFTIYGIAAWQLTLQFAPAYAVPLICFTAGGLVSVVFFRFSVMVLTASAGTLLIAYGGIALAETVLGLRIIADLAEYSLLVHLGLAGVALVGVLIQSRLARAQMRWAQKKLEDALWQQRLTQMKETETLRPAGLFGGLFRKAG